MYTQILPVLYQVYLIFTTLEASLMVKITAFFSRTLGGGGGGGEAGFESLSSKSESFISPAFRECMAKVPQSSQTTYQLFVLVSLGTNRPF